MIMLWIILALVWIFISAVTAGLLYSRDRSPQSETVYENRIVYYIFGLGWPIVLLVYGFKWFFKWAWNVGVAIWAYIDGRWLRQSEEQD